jgi:MerR family transcriptional regulator, light-induced transcriptional regulator
MTMPSDSLKTQTVARALGLSVSTIKRWVDSGTIQAVRTAGKHRLIPRAEAIRIATELGVDPGKLSRVAGVPAAEGLACDEASCDRLCELLKDGKGPQARLLIQSFYNSGCGAVALADRVIRPVMTRIGHSWMVGLLDIYQEHQASHIVASSVMELIERVSREQPASGPVALGATTEGDPYVLSSLLGELALREMGWEVRNLGVNLPLRSLANAALQYRPKLIFLSINYLRDPEHFVREYHSFYETAARCGAAVIVGGQALGPELRSRLVYTAFGDRMIILAEFARQLASTSSVAGKVSAELGRVSPPPLDDLQGAAR